MTVSAGAEPDTTLIRVQLLLAARGGCRTELAERAVAASVVAVGAVAAVAQINALTLVEIDDDPFPAANPLCRPSDVVIELEAPSSVGADALLERVGSALDPLRELVHCDLSGALVGAPQYIIPCDVSPIRYLYLMRRKAGTGRADYLDYYFHHHSRFGFVTPGIVGYTQFHVDPDASATAAHRLGVGTHAVDSVSELHFTSLDGFFAGVADGRLGAEAGADEERFVDRANSVSFCTTTRVPGP
jgi:EthD domain